MVGAKHSYAFFGKAQIYLLFKKLGKVLKLWRKFGMIVKRK